MSTTCVNRAISPRPVPRPNSAVTIGSPIAITEPNVISRTTIAASRPTAVEMPKPGCSVCSIACPPSWMSRPGLRGRFGGVHDGFGCALGEQVGFFVEDDRREGDPAVRGDRATRGRAAVRADHRRDVRLLRDFLEHRLHVRAHAGSLTVPESTLKTIVSRSPACVGKLCCQQVGGALGVRVGQREVVGVARPGRLRQHVHDQEQHDPPEHDVLAVGR